MFAHTSHLPGGHSPTASHNLSLSLGREETKTPQRCLDFSVTSNCCHTTYTKSRLNSTNSFMKAAGQPINAAKESKGKLKSFLKKEICSLSSYMFLNISNSGIIKVCHLVFIPQNHWQYCHLKHNKDSSYKCYLVVLIYIKFKLIY